MRHSGFKHNIIKLIGHLGFKIKAEVPLLLLVVVFSLKPIAYAQEEMEGLFKEQAYSDIIRIYGNSYRELDVKSLIILSATYERVNKRSEQIKVLEQILELKPNYFKVHYNLAEKNKEEAYAKIKEGLHYEAYEENLNKMVEHYKVSMSLEPKNILPYRGLMSVFKDQENVQEGIALSKTMLNIFGSTSETTLYLCRWNSKFGLVEQTRRACAAAGKHSPNRAEPFILLARTYEDAGETDKYQESIFSLLKKFPNDPEVVERAGIIYYNDQDYYNSEKILTRNKNKKFEKALLYLGYSLFQNGKYEEALAHLRSDCKVALDHKKEMLRFYEIGLRRLETHEDKGLRFKYQRAINNCKTMAAENTEIKIRPGHFEQGIRLPANTKELEGDTVREKRRSYEAQRRKGKEFKPSTGASQQMNKSK